MVSWLMLILMAVYLYHEYLSRRMDRRKLSHSSYYDVAYGGGKKSVDHAGGLF